ncbi:flavin reductase (NADPH) [Aplysia californica]|uniref:Flavin reductase (NADPH) n=1 Tax=Aplysia californica TaxID=6500 RepID=A0ABM0K2E3_APLCA|nr:flavin reductase (NADPH) [Aplysia californica]
MKLLVLGATGPTGQLVISEALDRGHEVIALARSPEKVTAKSDKLQVKSGDILSRQDLAAHMSGCDAVLSGVGGKSGTFNPCDVYSTSVRAIVEAMRDAGVTRFVTVTAWGTKDDPQLPFVWRWILKPTFLRHIMSDMSAMEDYIENQAKDLNYTVVRPPKLTKLPSQGGEVQVSEGQCVPGAGSEISRQDLARFMLDCLTTGDYDRKMIAVTGPKTKTG